MSRVTYDAGTMTITVEGMEDVAAALGDLKSKTPAVLKVAINATARQAARDAIKAAEQRYALTSRGREKLQNYRQKKKATNSDLLAVIHGDDDSLPLNMVYFEHTPEKPYMGKAMGAAPVHFRAKVLKNGGYKNLTEGAGRSKGFLVSIHNPKSGNDHLAILQRVLNSHAQRTVTNRGYKRWKSPNGMVEKVYDMERPGVSSMGRAVWDRGINQEAAENLERFVERRINQILDNAARRG